MALARFLSLSMLALATAGEQCAINIETGIDFSGNDCCGGLQTVGSVEECCNACQLKTGCQFWTYAAGLVAIPATYVYQST